MTKIFFQREKILSMHSLQWNPNNFLTTCWRLPGCIRYECLGGDVTVGFKTNAFWWWAHKHFLPFPVRAFLAVSRGCTPWMFWWLFRWNFIMITPPRSLVHFARLLLFARGCQPRIFGREHSTKNQKAQPYPTITIKKRLNGPQSRKKIAIF